MAMEQYFEEAVPQNDFGREDKCSSVEKQKSVADAVAESADSPYGGFDCNICLDCVQDPVVTLCGHLYCWPCIYKWIHFQSISQDQKQLQQQCPVCKAEVSADTLVPLYGRGKMAKPSNGKAPQLGIVIPRRPLGPVCGVISPRSPAFAMSPHLSPQPQTHHRNHHPQQSNLYYSQPGSYLASPMSSPGGTTTNVFNPMIGEMVYSRLFGNSITNTYPNTYNLAGSASPRMRRQVMQADKSLNRICSFLFCCIFLCLLLF